MKQRFAPCYGRCLMRVLCATARGSGGSGLNVTADLRTPWCGRGGCRWKGVVYRSARDDSAQRPSYWVYSGDIGIAPDGRHVVVAGLRFELPIVGGVAFCPNRLLNFNETCSADDGLQVPGIEFAHTLLVLPEQDNPGADPRAALYRHHPRQRLDLFAPLPLLQRAMGKRTERSSGLTRMLLRP